MECLERAEVPLGTRPMLEQEIDWVQDAIQDGFDLQNRHPFYNSPASEIDEALITHIDGEQVWVIGIWDQAERRAALTVVGNDRSQQRLQQILNRNLVIINDEGHPFLRTRIYHDGQRGYGFLQNELSDYEGFSILHNVAFGEGCHSTNRIEGFWSDLRRETQFQRGANPNNIFEAQILVDLGNWRIKTLHEDHAILLANALRHLFICLDSIQPTIVRYDRVHDELQDMYQQHVYPRQNT